MPARQWMNHRLEGNTYSITVRLEFDDLLTDEQYLKAEQILADSASVASGEIYELLHS